MMISVPCQHRYKTRIQNEELTGPVIILVSIPTNGVAHSLSHEITLSYSFEALDCASEVSEPFFVLRGGYHLMATRYLHIVARALIGLLRKYQSLPIKLDFSLQLYRCVIIDRYR